MAESADHRAALRDADRDRYLASLLAPPAAAADLVLLYLFNAEIASIRERISEPMPGEIRLQWWREAVEGLRDGEAAAHPVAGPFLEMARRRRLPVPALTGMCEARIFDLYDDPMPDREAYEHYAGATASALIQLSLLILAPEAAPGLAHSSGHAGVAQAVAGHLMLLPRHRRAGQVYLPGDLLSATGLDRDSFLSGQDRGRISTAIAGFAAFGRDHLAKARAALGPAEGAAFAAYLPVAIAADVFDRAEKAGAGALDQSPRPPQWLRQWRIWRASRGGRL